MFPDDAVINISTRAVIVFNVYLVDTTVWYKFSIFDLQDKEKP